MKLRNKKTGEIVDVESLGHDSSLKEKYGYQVTLSWATEYEYLSQCKDYHSLAEINEEWEDYKPAEPLIKDEKIRKAVRTWADVVGTDKCTYDRFWETLRSMDTSISFAGVYKFELEDEENYTIAELCGEEE